MSMSITIIIRIVMSSVSYLCLSMHETLKAV